MKGLKKFLIYAGVGLASLGIFSTQNVSAEIDYGREGGNGTVSTPTSASQTGATQTSNNQKALEDWSKTLEVILQMLYAIMWPLIAIAGSALSNDMVFGRAFGLDKALFDFWSIMKNIANLMIGFLFVGGILMYMFNNKKGGDRKSMIPKFLLAVLGIQASRFIMMALVDIGTIATFTVGSLPISVSDKNQVDESFRIYNSIQLNLPTEGNSTSNMTVYGVFKDGVGPIVVSCIKKDGKDFITPQYENGDAWKNYIQPIINHFEKNLVPVTDIKTNQKYYMSSKTQTVPIDGEFKEAKIDQNHCILAGSRMIQFEGTSGAKYTLKPEGGVSIKEYIENAPATQKLSGPLYTMYVSILSMTGLGEIASGADTKNFIFVVILKTFIGLALMIPLAVLAIVLVMRVAMLWIIISFSPLIIMAIAFGYDKKLGGSIKNYANFSNIISLIFLPTIVTFAISMAVLFMTSLLTFWNAKTPESNQANINGNEVTEAVDIKTYPDGGNGTCYQVRDSNTICMSGDNNPLMGLTSIFTFLVVGLLGAAIMWNILFLALKSSEFTKGFAQGVQGLGEGFIKSMPIVPVPGAGLSSISAVNSFKDRYINERSPWITDITGKQESALGSFIKESTGGDKAAIKTGSTEIKELLDSGSGVGVSYKNGKVENVDADKFISGIGAKVSDTTRIDDYINPENSAKWNEVLDKLWDQAGLGKDRGNNKTLAQMLQNPVFASYMMASTGENSIQDILNKFYKRQQVDRVAYSMDYSAIQGDLVKDINGKKVVITPAGLVVYTLNQDGKTYSTKILGKDAKANDVKNALGDNGSYAFGDENKSILEEFGFSQTSVSGPWSFDPNKVKNDEFYKVINPEGKKYFENGNIIENSELGKALNGLTNIKDSLTGYLNDIIGTDISKRKTAIGNLESLLSETGAWRIDTKLDTTKVGEVSLKQYLFKLLEKAKSLPDDVTTPNTTPTPNT